MFPGLKMQTVGPAISSCINITIRVTDLPNMKHGISKSGAMRGKVLYYREDKKPVIR